MKGRRQGARHPVGQISGRTVAWRFERKDDHEGRLIGTIDYEGLTFEGVADVVPRFLANAINPEVLWQEHTRRVASSLRTSLWRLRQLGA
jgi:hypothetical protein